MQVPLWLYVTTTITVALIGVAGVALSIWNQTRIARNQLDHAYGLWLNGQRLSAYTDFLEAEHDFEKELTALVDGREATVSVVPLNRAYHAVHLLVPTSSVERHLALIDAARDAALVCKAHSEGTATTDDVKSKLRQMYPPFRAVVKDMKRHLRTDEFVPAESK